MPISFYYTLLAVVLVSLVSLSGAAYLVVAKERLSRFIPAIVPFAAGALLGAALFDLLPESIESLPEHFSIFMALGIVGFLVFEYLMHWHHHHHDECHDCDHTTAYSVLAGDAIHNFMDGIVIASAFFAQPSYWYRHHYCHCPARDPSGAKRLCHLSACRLIGQAGSFPKLPFRLHRHSGRW